MQLKRALVVDNDDSAFDGNKYSRIKVKVLPEMKDIEDDMLPWIKPFKTGNGTGPDSTAQDIPEIDSYIWVLVLDEFWKEIRYLWGVDIEGYVSYQKFEEISSNISDLGNQTYPQPYKFEYYADGSCFLRNTSTGETCLYHANGSYTMFDADGNIINYAKDKNIKCYTDNTTLELNDTNKTIIAETGTAKLTLDSSSTSTFTLEDGTNTIESVVTPIPSVTINNNLEILI